MTNIYFFIMETINRSSKKFARMIPVSTEVKTEAIPMPAGSSDCLYTLDTTFMNFIFSIFAEAGYLFNLKQIKGASTYVYPSRHKSICPLSGNLNAIIQAARRATPAENNIFTLLKVQKPDFSTTRELGNLLLKYAIAFFLLASNLGLLSKLLVNIYTFHNKVALHIIYDFNTKKHLREL